MFDLTPAQYAAFLNFATCTDLAAILELVEMGLLRFGDDHAPELTAEGRHLYVDLVRERD